MIWKIVILVFLIFDALLGAALLWYMICLSEDVETMRREYLEMLETEVATTRSCFDNWKETIEKWDGTVKITEQVLRLNHDLAEWLRSEDVKE